MQPIAFFYSYLLLSITKKTIDYATISVYQGLGTKPITGTTSNQKGGFIIGNLQPGTYSIAVDFIGYHSKTIDNITIDRKTINRSLGDIAIARTSQTLQDVVVTAKKGLIENKIDKMIYNAEKDITSQGGLATDIQKLYCQLPYLHRWHTGIYGGEGIGNRYFSASGRW